MKGDCLITVATGPMSESDADRAGLVPTHAYALLDIRKVLVSLVGSCSFMRSFRCFSVLDLLLKQLAVKNATELLYSRD